MLLTFLTITWYFRKISDLSYKTIYCFQTIFWPSFGKKTVQCLDHGFGNGVFVSILFSVLKDTI